MFSILSASFEFQMTTLKLHPWFSPPPLATMISILYWKCLFTSDNGISCMLICSSPRFQQAVNGVLTQLCALWVFEFVCVCCSYIGAEGRVQYVGLQPFEVDVSEDGVLLDLYGPSTLAAQALLRVLSQELTRSRRKRKRRKRFKQWNSLKSVSLNGFGWS